MRRVIAAVGALVLLAVTSAAGQPAGKKELKGEKPWTGRLAGKEKEALKDLAPPRGYVAGPKTFAALWKAWRSEEKVPDVDFDKKIVLVATSSGPNMVGLTAYLDDKGDVTTKAISTLIGGPGFGYALLPIDRAGVKTINGKTLEKQD